jgi:excisionase family DNA binding protein
MKNDRPLTTGDIAKYCSVTVATVCNWVKAGKLEVFVTPGGQYRMERQKFMGFLKDNNFPIPKDLIAETTRVLTIDPTHRVTSALRETLAESDTPVEVQEAANGYEALLKIGQISPGYLVVSGEDDENDLGKVVRFLKQNPSTKKIKLVYYSSGNGSASQGGDTDTYDARLTSPVDAGELRRLFFRNSA